MLVFSAYSMCFMCSWVCKGAVSRAGCRGCCQDQPLRSASVKGPLRKHGFFEFSECLDSSAFKGCYAHWLIASGEDVLIAFPRDGRNPFIADCPSAMREN